MTGDAVFNEVFLDDAVCDDARPHRRRGQRLGGHADDAELRAHRHRRRRRARRVPRARPEGRHARAPGRRRRCSTGAQRQADRRLPRRDRAGQAAGRRRRTPCSARTWPGSTPTPNSGCGTPSGARPRRRAAAVRRWPASASSPRPDREAGGPARGRHLGAPRACSPARTASRTASTPRPWCSRRRRPSTAAPTRSSATSSPSARSACPGTRRRIGADRSARCSGSGPSRASRRRLVSRLDPVPATHRPRGSGVDSYETLLYEEQDGVAIVTLNRPEVHNAFNIAMQSELQERLALAAPQRRRPGRRRDRRGREGVLQRPRPGGEHRAGLPRRGARGPGDGRVSTPFMYNDLGAKINPKAERPLEAGHRRRQRHGLRRRALPPR